MRSGEHGVGVEKCDLMPVMFNEDDLNQQRYPVLRPSAAASRFLALHGDTQTMPREPRRHAPFQERRPRRRAAGRLRFPFWAGWVALIAGASFFHLVVSPRLSPPMGQRAAYQCSRNAYNCSDFRTRAEAQAVYQACGGRGNDVHRLDEDRDGLACERLPLVPWIGRY
jgi:Excalibur calcium-binding domain